MCSPGKYLGPLGKVRAPAVGADLACVDQSCERLANRGGLSGGETIVMKLIQVDVIRIQTAKRVFTGFVDAFRCGITAGHLAGGFIKNRIELSGNHNLAAATFELS